jgi:hypothetical protein
MIQHVEKPHQREAYRAYIALGRQRSIAKLAESLREDWGKSGLCETTLENWSRWFRWQSRVIQDDQLIEGRVDERMRQKEIDRRQS